MEGEQQTFGPEFDLPSIRGYFIARDVPDGEAPLEIREQWLGVALPIRYERKPEGPDRMLGSELFSKRPVDLEDGVEIVAYDCIEALKRLERYDAAVYWRDKLLYPLRKHLVFNAKQGVLISPEARKRFFPES